VCVCVCVCVYACVRELKICVSSFSGLVFVRQELEKYNTQTLSLSNTHSHPHTPTHTHTPTHSISLQKKTTFPSIFHFSLYWSLTKEQKIISHVIKCFSSLKKVQSTLFTTQDYYSEQKLC